LFHKTIVGDKKQIEVLSRIKTGTDVFWQNGLFVFDTKRSWHIRLFVCNSSILNQNTSLLLQTHFKSINITKLYKIFFVFYFNFLSIFKMKGKFKIIKRSYLWLMISLMLVAWAWLIFLLNVKFSSEFTGGVKMTVDHTLQTEQVEDKLTSHLQEMWYENTTVLISNHDDIATLTLKTKVSNDEKVNQLSIDIKTFLVDNQYIETNENIMDLAITWPSVGAYMQKAALTALIVGIIFMSIYMLFSFATIRKYVSPVVLAVVTVITMLFDVSIPIWAYWFWMMVNPVIQVDTIFVIAILTTMWYSINDTIVIFDRIRENMQAGGSSSEKTIVWKIFEKSLRQTMRRSIGTSLSTLLVIIAMYILGTGVIQQFAFTMWIWVVAGTFSSIFIAAPLAYLLLWRYSKEKDKL